jgi:hypothetical protein
MTFDIKRLAIMQPYFLPYIGYFQLIAAVDKFVIYDDVNFINKGWINRNRMLANGEPLLFTVPVSGASQNRLICDLRLSLDKSWQIRLLKTIELNYRKAPQFQVVFPLLQKVILYAEVELSAFVLNSLKEVSLFLGIADKFVKTSMKYGNSHLQGQDRILDICVQEGASIYVNAAGGVALYERHIFAASNITLQILRSDPWPYTQGKAGYVGSLSIIDVLMWNDRAALQSALGSFTLI